MCTTRNKNSTFFVKMCSSGVVDFFNWKKYLCLLHYCIFKREKSQNNINTLQINDVSSAKMHTYQHTQDVNKSLNKLYENETNWIKWNMALYYNYIFIGFKKLVRKLTLPILKRRSLWNCQQNRNGVNTFSRDSCNDNLLWTSILLMFTRNVNNTQKNILVSAGFYYILLVRNY